MQSEHTVHDCVSATVCATDVGGTPTQREDPGCASHALSLTAVKSVACISLSHACGVSHRQTAPWRLGTRAWAVEPQGPSRRRKAALVMHGARESSDWKRRESSPPKTLWSCRRGGVACSGERGVPQLNATHGGLKLILSRFRGLHRRSRGRRVGSPSRRLSTRPSP